MLIFIGRGKDIFTYPWALCLYMARFDMILSMFMTLLEDWWIDKVIGLSIGAHLE